jgi:signal transduction histidine kinase
MRVTSAVATVLFLVALLTWLSLRAVSIDAEPFDRALGALDDFATLESALQRDVLRARAGTLRNYDPLAREADSLSDLLDRLRATAGVDAETAAAVDRLATSVSRQGELVEQFKSANALLRNSLTYFGLFGVRLATSEQDGRLVSAVSAATAAILNLMFDTSPAAARDAEFRLDELSRQPFRSENADLVQALLAHGRLLHRLLPTTDGVLKGLVAIPGKQEQDVVRTMVLRRQEASRATARKFRSILYATSLLLLGVLIYLAHRLRARRLALKRRAALEHVIATISTRFINAQRHEMGELVRQALAELAERVSADRAYFVMAGTPSETHAWSREGIAFPPGWPERALDLAGRTASTTPGVIHVPRVDRMPIGEEKRALAAAGVACWGCVCSAGEGGVAVLGFDAVQVPIDTRTDELCLLRNTLNAIVGAFRRGSLERERARLETRLQQARRMETVGALASGIAHNFNNILGAILGHTELAEAKLASDSHAVRNLDAIRRAGERARDLVDQILAFGRRRDARRRPVGVQALVAEADSLLRASLPARIELVLRMSPQAASVSGEPAQLQQVILNLCNNAAQAMDGAGRIEVETDMHEIVQVRPLSHGELQPGRYVRIAVKDAGRGIDEATMERIFEPFFTTRSAGNGLGLATVREIVREHGGAMNVSSAPGQGSRFEVWLPCIATPAPASEEAAPALPLGRGETVLVVDADRARLLRDEEMLAALGYEPVGFTRAADALAACRATLERFDAAVVGQLGSVRSSFDLAAAMHAAIPSLPIVLATASADRIGTDALLVGGIFEVVRRPLISTEIAAVLRRGLALPRKVLSA